MLYNKNDHTRETLPVLDGDDDARKASLSDYQEVRRTIHLVRFFLDSSGSMYKLMPTVVNATIKGLETARDTEVEDYDTLCQVITFAADVTELNEKPLPPADLLDGFDPDSIRADGCTNLGEVYQYMAKSYTRANPYIEQSSYGPAPAITDILVTDAKATDSKAHRQASIQHLEDNSLAKRRQDLLVIYMGEENPAENKELVQLVRGKTENLMSMSAYEAKMENLLAARICQSIINLSDPTYVKGENAGDNFRDAVYTTDTEKKSAASLSTSTLFQDAAKLREKMNSFFPPKPAV